MVKPLRIPNRQARHLLIASHGLAKPPTGPLDVIGIIRDMGFVQLDTIRTVTRAHHHILWSRNQNYREPMLWKALEKRDVFEHFTHDASILPIELYPVWHRQFNRLRQRFQVSKRWVGYTDLHDAVKARIADEGALSTHAFDTKIEGPKEMWSRPPHKRALDYLWYVGELSTCHRENFTKFYDLTERVIPPEHQTCTLSDREQLNALCEAALDRLGFAARAEIQDFWGAASAAEISDWLRQSKSPFVPVEVETSDGTWTSAYAAQDIEDRLARLRKPTSRLRILNPFDPLVRNRKRLLRIFGFEYRNEMFVPAAQRQWGYYVYPILESGRFVGRVELKADRKACRLNVVKFWPEIGIKWTGKRAEKLTAELSRLARLVDCESIHY